MATAEASASNRVAGPAPARPNACRLLRVRGMCYRFTMNQRLAVRPSSQQGHGSCKRPAKGARKGLPVIMGLAALGLLSSLVGCGPTATTEGDPLSKPNADPYGNGAQISELVGPATWFDAQNDASDGCSIPLDRNVFVTGTTVTAIDDYDETGSGARGNVYVQDSVNPPVPYSGMTVFEPSFSPPDLKIVSGDVLDVFGLLLEFPGPATAPFSQCRTLPEIGGTVSFRFEGGRVDPIEINVDDLADYQKARQWLGMLVTIKNVPIQADPYEKGGRYSIRMQSGNVEDSELPQITNELFDLKNDGPAISKGQTLKSLTGIVTFFFNFHIAPRSGSDIVP